MEDKLMKIKKKLEGIRDSIIDYGQELAEVKDLNAEEYAAYYGGNYTNFLRAVNTKVFLAKSERNNNESEEVTDDVIIVEMQIKTNNDGILTFDEPKYLGQKETLEQKKIGFLLAKAGMSATIDAETNCLVIENRTAIDKLSETKDEYIGKINEKFAEAGATLSEAAGVAKEKVSSYYQENKAKAGEAIKKSLRKASDWADKNL